ncbi:MAG: hypothetical protein AAGI12_15455, partial [Pseudomonadota bacterium]
HPSVYRAFKQNGSEPISIRALKKDPLTGTTQELKTPNDLLVRDIISDVMRFYGPMTPSKLVALSHAKDAPWSVVVDKARTSVAMGMRIPDILIQERFQHHKVSLGASSVAGEPPSDDAPIT